MCQSLFSQAMCPTGRFTGRARKRRAGELGSLPSAIGDDNLVACHSAEHPCRASALSRASRMFHGLRLATNDHVFIMRPWPHRG